MAGLDRFIKHKIIIKKINWRRHTIMIAILFSSLLIYENRYLKYNITMLMTHILLWRNKFTGYISPLLCREKGLLLYESINNDYFNIQWFKPVWDAKVLRTQEIITQYKLWITKFVRLFWSEIIWPPNFILQRIGGLSFMLWRGCMIFENF